MRRVTLDSNEYISVLAFGGKEVRLLHMAIDGDIEVAVSEPRSTKHRHLAPRRGRIRTIRTCRTTGGDPPLPQFLDK